MTRSYARASGMSGVCMTSKKVRAWLAKYWYVVLFALATFEAFTSGVIVWLFGEWVGWAVLVALIVASLVALLESKRG